MSKADFLERLDSAAENFEFPAWECGGDNNFVGAMRTSGFTSDSGVALVFEKIEYSLDESAIQCVAFCFATFPVTKWLSIGEAVYLNLSDAETGELSISFGQVQVSSREQTFTVPFEKEELKAGGYLESKAEAPTPEALLFKICDTIPREWLFCEPDYLKQVFGMSLDTKRLFVCEEWQHLVIDELYEDEQVKPSSSPDIVAMVEALYSGNSAPKLIGTPNTSWRVQNHPA